MPEMQKSKLNKFRTVLYVLFLIITIYSILFTVVEAHHECECTEHDCPICFVLQVVKTNLGGLILVCVVSEIIHHFAKSKKILFSFINKSFILNTLFSLKIRLND